uniref:non-specific serine/threonine protein kinase n=1 Tax=Leptobrachium leishanense TaxID=445787 RepID=A0A8C5QEH0_9ANUR
MDEVAMLKTKGYKLGIHLGEGSYAKVKSAYSSKLKCNVAVKIINRKKAPADFVKKFLPREMEIFATLDHNSIIKMHESFESEEIIYIIMELAVKGNLLDFIKKKGALTEESALKMFTQLVTAVKYCHDLNIVHRDLKCENILLDQELNIKLSDFGFGRRVPHSPGHSSLSKTFCGSSAYAAPEILQGIPYRPKICDIWSLGVILYIMVCGSMPYNDSNIKEMLHIQKEHSVKFPGSKHLSRNCKDLIRQMLQPDVTKRLTAAEVLDHSWFLRPKKLKAQDATKRDAGSFADHAPGRGHNIVYPESKDEMLPPPKHTHASYRAPQQ